MTVEHNHKPGFINTIVGVYFCESENRVFERVSIELETPFTYTEAKQVTAKKLGVDVKIVSRITFN